MTAIEEDEEYFPRGGAKGQKKSIKSDKTYIFQTNKPEVVHKKKPGRKERQREKAKKIILESEELGEDEELNDESITEKLEPFAYKNLTDGILSMCSINQIHDRYLVVTLPERKYARIPINLISQPIKELAEQNSSSVKLKDYFSLGYCLPCRIVKVTHKSNTWEVIATTDPTSINCNVQFNSIGKGYTLIATIKSREDYGFIMDTGIQGVNAFLPHSNIGDDHSKRIDIGQLLWCKVIQSELSETTNVIKLTVVSKGSSNTCLKSVATPDILIPGVQVKVTVVKITERLLYVTELSSNGKGYIPVSHLEHPWSKISEYKIGMEYIATVLYKFPHVDIVCYSLKVKPNTVVLPEITNGTLFNRAMVVSKNQPCIYVQLEHNDQIEKGVISKFKLLQKIDIDKLNDLFPIGNHISVRVLEFHNLDGVYCCTTSTDEHVSDMKVGQLVDVKITKEVVKGYVGSVGTLKAFIPRSHSADNLDVKSKIKINHTYSGRIWLIYGSSLTVTLLSSLVNNKPFTNFNKVKQGEEYFGTVKRILSNGIVVTFFNNLKAFIKDSNLPIMPNKYKVGELIKCRILKVVKGAKPILSVTNPLEGMGLKIGFQNGVIVKSVSDKGLDCITLANNKLIECFLPVEHLSDCLKLCPALLKTYEVGAKIKNTILYTFEDDKPIFTLRHSVSKFFEDHPDIKENGIFALQKGHKLPATVSKLNENEILLDVPLTGYNGKIYAPLPKKMKLKVNQGITVIVKKVCPMAKNISVVFVESDSSLIHKRKELTSFLKELSKFQNRKPGDEVKAKVISIDEKSVNVILLDDKVTKGIITRRCNKKFKIDEKISTILLYEDPIENIAHLCFKSEDLSRGSGNGVRIVEMNEDFSVGISIVKNDIVVSNPITVEALKLWQQTTGKTFLSSDFLVLFDKLRKIDKFTLGCFSWKKYFTSVLNSKKSGKNTKKVIPVKKTDKKNVDDSIEETDEDEEELMSESEENVDEEHDNTLDTGNDSEEQMDEDVSSSEENIDDDQDDDDDEDEDDAAGDDDEEEVEEKLNSTKKLKEKLVVKEKNSTVAERLKRKSEPENLPSSKKKKLNEINVKLDSSMNETDDDDNKIETAKKLKKSQKTKTLKNSNENIETKIADQKKRYDKDGKNESEASKALIQKKLKELENLSLDTVGGFEWSATPADLAKTVAMGKMATVKEDSDEEIEVKKKKKLTPAEKKAAQIEAERQIREKEEELLRCEQNPQSADHFERLLLTNPNHSKLWIQYMAFHLQGTDIDKARSVALRALKQINVREENERLNVWIALLNLENIYGSSECFQKTLSDALKYNNDYQVYMKVLGMYCDTQKVSELDKLTNHLVRKFKDKTECWYECQSALMRIGLTDKARNFLQRSLTSLPKKEHISLISRFALLENKHGFHEQAQSLFENLLTSYPQRIDLWNVYVDMLLKSGSIDLARSVLERITSHKLPLRKMRAIYKRWLQFEEKYGTQKSVENVRKAAEEYLCELFDKKDKSETNKNETVERDENEDSDSGDEIEATIENQTGTVKSDEEEVDSDEDDDDSDED